MARYDVYANPETHERQHTPYLLDVQNDYINSLGTRMVIPLRSEAAFGRAARGLNPAFLVGEVTVCQVRRDDRVVVRAVPPARARATDARRRVRSRPRA